PSAAALYSPVGLNELLVIGVGRGRTHQGRVVPRIRLRLRLVGALDDGLHGRDRRGVARARVRLRRGGGPIHVRPRRRDQGGEIDAAGERGERECEEAEGQKAPRGDAAAPAGRRPRSDRTYRGGGGRITFEHAYSLSRPPKLRLRTR